MKKHRQVSSLADDLDLDQADQHIMKLKAKLYSEAVYAIQTAKLTHNQIAAMMGTSRTRITRIANMGENSLSIELLIKILVVLKGKMPLKIAA